METISFVIPCYNSEKTIEAVVRGIVEKVSERPEYDYEIITVNDCSPDHVIGVLKQLAAENDRVRIVDLAGNVGKHTAVLVGYRFARGRYVVSLDDDGQCPIEELWRLLAPLEEGHDMSMARYTNQEDVLYKRLGSRINHKVSQILLDKPEELVFTNFIARQNYICKAMAQYRNIFPYLEGLSLRITRDIVMVPMIEKPRLHGKSNFTFKKSLALWVNGFTAFSVKPLRISTIIGAVTASVGFIYGIIKIIRKILIPSISIGYSSLFVAILFFSGMVLMMLGLSGEYLGRVYLSVNRYPQYVIKNKVNFPEESSDHIGLQEEITL